MTATDKIWINIDAPWDGMVNDRHGTNGFPCYHHQRTVDELLAMAERLETLCSSHAAKVGLQHAWWDDIFDARALIAKHRKGG